MRTFVAWIRHHVHSLADALRRLALAPLATLLNLIVIGTAVTLPVAGYLIIDNLRGLAPRVGSDPQLSVFLATDATRVEIARIEALIRASPLVERVRFISKDEAFSGLKKNAALTDVIGTLKSNPLPDAFTVSLNRIAPGEAEALAMSLRSEAKVAQVQLDATWMRRLEGFLNVGRALVAAFAALFAIGLAAVTFNTIRLQIVTRADEIEVSRLVGATDRFIRRPLYYYGALTGLAGGLIGWGAVTFLVERLNREIGPLASLYGSTFQLGQLALVEAAAILAISAGLGSLGAWMSASMHLHRLQPR